MDCPRIVRRPTRPAPDLGLPQDARQLTRDLRWTQFASSTCSTPGARSVSASQKRRGCRRVSSSLRKVTISSRRSAWRCGRGRRARASNRRPSAGPRSRGRRDRSRRAAGAGPGRTRRSGCAPIRAGDRPQPRHRPVDRSATERDGQRRQRFARHAVRRGAAVIASSPSSSRTNGRSFDDRGERQRASARPMQPPTRTIAP